MIKIIIATLFTLTVSSAFQSIIKNAENKTKEIIHQSYNKILEEDRPTKVRTVEELERRSSECVVLDFIGIVEQFGYTAAEYNVTTVDGYILKIHRVTGSPKALNPKVKGKPVVFISHGLLTDSDFYVFHGPDYDLGNNIKGLMYLLADNGYDVWIGNVRGTSYSRSHVNYSHLDSEFWNFSIDEQALIDTPTFINFALEHTGQSKLTYIGYSMGTTEIHMLLSSKTEYNEKINLLISIAPVVIFDPLITSFQIKAINRISEALRILEIKEVVPQSCTVGKIGDIFCKLNKPNICTPFARSITTHNMINITHTLPSLLQYFPAGIAYNAIEHYNQMFKSGKFQKFDFSYKSSEKSLNIVKYNQTEPPEYDLSLITTPAVLFLAPKDIFVPIKNANVLRKKLLNVVSFNLVPDENFKHGDFFLNVKSKDLVFQPLIDIMFHQLSKIKNSSIS